MLERELQVNEDAHEVDVDENDEYLNDAEAAKVSIDQAGEASGVKDKKRPNATAGTEIQQEDAGKKYKTEEGGKA